MPDRIDAVLEQLGAPDADPLRALDELLVAQPAQASAVVDRLLPLVARAASGPAAGRITVALGAACVAARDPSRGRVALLEGLAMLRADDHATAARGGAHLAAADVALGDGRAALVRLEEVLPRVLRLGDEGLLGRVAAVLRARGDAIGAALAEHAQHLVRRAAPPRPGARVELLAQISRELATIGARGGAEPLHTILRTVLDETRADRAVLMLYDGCALRAELALGRDGRILDADERAVSMTVVERSLEAREPVLVPDLAAAPPFAQATSARDLRLRAALSVPLNVDRRRPGAPPDPVPLPALRGVAGVLYVDATSPGSFGVDDGAFLEAAADGALLAVRLARASELLRANASPAAETPPRRKGAKSRLSPASPLTARLQAVARRHPDVVTADPSLLAVLELVERVAPTAANVLIRGESGTGKELVARAVHRLGRGAASPFVVIDCGTLSDELVPSELFGHEKDAFTGAGAVRAGLLERAHGGTLFLDEVGEMSAAFQSALLRALQEGEVRRVGADHPRSVDVRVVAASHRDLRALVERGAFRQDLLFRLAGFELELPPLRERPDDVRLLLEHCVKTVGPEVRPRSFEPAALARLESHAWPGNVRELENVVRALCIAGEGPVSLAEVERALSRSAVAPAEERSSEGAPGGALAGTLAEVERRAIIAHLERAGWHQAQAARTLGVDRGTLSRKIVRHGIVRPRG